METLVYRMEYFALPIVEVEFFAKKKKCCKKYKKTGKHCKSCPKD